MARAKAAIATEQRRVVFTQELRFQGRLGGRLSVAARAAYRSGAKALEDA
jgi:hypothetical protein